MTDTKRKHKLMTAKQIAQYQELRANLMAQVELIMSVFCPLNDREHVTGVEFERGRPLGPQIDIWYHFDCPGVDCDNYFSCPEKYLSMTADELKAEKKRLKEEEERKKVEKAAKVKAEWEKRKAKKEAEKKAKEKDERYKKYLELKKEFEGNED